MIIKKLSKIGLLGLSILTLSSIHSSPVLATSNNFDSEEAISISTDSNSRVLQGKRIVFLGSSITLGLASGNVSFVDLLKKNDGIVADKQAVSGTAMAGITSLNYVNRMKKRIPTNKKLDAFVTQLSTNDDKIFKKPIGSISSSYELKDFNTNTTTGAIEYIAKYVQDNWGCPLVFYTCLNRNDSNYHNLVNRLYELQNKWHFRIIDLFNDSGLNDIMYQKYSNNMADNVHPTKKGYEVLTPYFEKVLVDIFK